MEERFLYKENLMIEVGWIVFIVELFGCCGDDRESKWMIMIFEVLIEIVFVLEMDDGIDG